MRKTDMIYEIVTMEDVLRDFAGVFPKKHRLNVDPINGCEGHDGFAAARSVYHCFICGDKGNVIQFVAKMLNCDFREAMDAINARYHLWDDNGVTGLSPFEQRNLAEKAEKRRQMQRLKDYKADQYEKERLMLEQLEADKERFAPKKPGDDLDPRFVEACQKYEAQAFKVDSMKN